MTVHEHTTNPAALTLAEGFFHRMFFQRAPGTANAVATDDMYMWLWWFCLAWFVFLMGLLGFFVIRYRRRPGKIAQTSTSHNTPLEIAWTVIPTLFLVYIFFKGFWGYMDKVVSPGHAIEMNITGVKWNWSLQYPNGAESTYTTRLGAKEIPVFYMPAETPIRLRMISQDVMHALWVPDFRIKQDVLPNRYTTFWFQANAPSGDKVHPMNDLEAKGSKAPFIAELAGVPYEDHIIYCAEYCGDEHSEMAAVIRVVSDDAFARWLDVIANPTDKSPVELGEIVWKLKCASCHSIDGSRNTGPTWKNIFNTNRRFTDGSSAVADEEYIRNSILYPARQVVEGYPNNMPLIPLRERQLEGVIAFIKSLSDDPLVRASVLAPPAEQKKEDGQDAPQ